MSEPTITTPEERAAEGHHDECTQESCAVSMPASPAGGDDTAGEATGRSGDLTGDAVKCPPRPDAGHAAWRVTGLD